MMSFSAMLKGMKDELSEDELSEAIRGLVEKGLIRPVANGWELTERGTKVMGVLEDEEHDDSGTR